MRLLLSGSLSRENFRELQLPVTSKTPTFRVSLQSSESISCADYICSQALCAGLLSRVVSRDIDMSLYADRRTQAEHADLSERVSPGEAPILPDFEKEKPTQRAIVRKVHDRLADELPVSCERTQTLRALLALQVSKD